MCLIRSCFYIAHNSTSVEMNIEHSINQHFNKLFKKKKKKKMYFKEIKIGQSNIKKRESIRLKRKKISSMNRENEKRKKKKL